MSTKLYLLHKSENAKSIIILLFPINERIEQLKSI